MLFAVARPAKDGGGFFEALAASMDSKESLIFCLSIHLFFGRGPEDRGSLAMYFGSQSALNS